MCSELKLNTMFAHGNRRLAKAGPSDSSRKGKANTKWIYFFRTSGRLCPKLFPLFGPWSNIPNSVMLLVKCHNAVSHRGGPDLCSRTLFFCNIWNACSGIFKHFSQCTLLVKTIQLGKLSFYKLLCQKLRLKVVSRLNFCHKQDEELLDR